MILNIFTRLINEMDIVQSTLQMLVGWQKSLSLIFFWQKRLRAFLEYFAERFWNGINFLSRMLFAERLNWSHAMVKMSPRRQFSCIYFVEWFVGLICFLLEPEETFKVLRVIMVYPECWVFVRVLVRDFSVYFWHVSEMHILWIDRSKSSFLEKTDLHQIRNVWCSITQWCVNES